MSYSPELHPAVSGLVRRIAWALRMPMTIALEDLVLHVAESVDPENV